MKKLYPISWIGLIITVLIWLVRKAVMALPDWAVRVNGIVMIITMAVFAFCTVRMQMEKKEEE